MQIIYEPHPVNPERKAELRKQGFKIVDIKFKPLGHDVAVGADADALQAQAQAETEAEAKVHPLDHDGDGKPGGSLPNSIAPRRRGRPRKAD